MGKPKTPEQKAARAAKVEAKIKVAAAAAADAATSASELEGKADDNGDDWTHVPVSQNGSSEPARGLLQENEELQEGEEGAAGEEEGWEAAAPVGAFTAGEESEDVDFERDELQEKLLRQDQEIADLTCQLEEMEAARAAEGEAVALRDREKRQDKALAALRGRLVMAQAASAGPGQWTAAAESPPAALSGSRQQTLEALPFPDGKKGTDDSLRVAVLTELERRKHIICMLNAGKRPWWLTATMPLSELEALINRFLEEAVTIDGRARGFCSKAAARAAAAGMLGLGVWRWSNFGQRRRQMCWRRRGGKRRRMTWWQQGVVCPRLSGLSSGRTRRRGAS